MGVKMNPMFINLIKGCKIQLFCTVSLIQCNDDELRGQFLSQYEVCGNSPLTDEPEFEGLCKASEHPETVHQLVANLVLQCVCVVLSVSGLHPKRWVGDNFGTDLRNYAPDAISGKTDKRGGSSGQDSGTTKVVRSYLHDKV